MGRTYTPDFRLQPARAESGFMVCGSAPLHIAQNRKCRFDSDHDMPPPCARPIAARVVKAGPNVHMLPLTAGTIGKAMAEITAPPM